MKHYLMTFLILFSALSSSWAGAVVFPETQTHLSYDCTTMQSEKTSDVQKMDNAYCINCFDQCQCDSSTCHKVNSPLVGIHVDPVHAHDLVKRPPLSVFTPLQNAPVFLDFRPPKYS